MVGTMSWKTTLFTSLDGKVDASGDWQFPWFDEEYFEVLSQIWAGADALLIGGTSFRGYEELATAFPDSPMVALLSGAPTYVASRSRTASEHYPHVEWLSDLERVTIDRLTRAHDDIVILGSPSLVIDLLEREILDRLNLAVIPTVVGTGRGLYDSATRALTFSRTETRTLTSGVLLVDLHV